MKKIAVIVSVSILSLFSGCRKDFIVEDIKGKTIVVNAPANNLVTTKNLVTFWWEELYGAEKYVLQVVEPDFANTRELVLDTTLEKNKFNFYLQPGNYQWRIKAVNAGHSTAYQIFNIKVDTTHVLTELVVNLLSPANGMQMGTNTVIFKWAPIKNAKNYRIVINEGAVVDTITEGTEAVFSLPALPNANTDFRWNVKAMNEISESGYNTLPSTFTIDLKPPAAPSILSPANGAVVQDSIRLIWNRNHPADVSYDSIYVSTDSLFTNIISQTWAETSSIKISELANTPNPNNTTYWWRLRSFDAAGNRSVFSSQFKFILVPQ